MTYSSFLTLTEFVDLAFVAIDALFKLLERPLPHGKRIDDHLAPQPS